MTRHERVLAYMARGYSNRRLYEMTGVLVRSIHDKRHQYFGSRFKTMTPRSGGTEQGVGDVLTRNRHNSTDRQFQGKGIDND
ncbi:MAG: hypothetical protein ACTS5I_11575 [Rhodanobacter sp.]